MELILFYFFSLALLFGVFYFADKIFNFTADVENSKFPQVDGLRAFLALSVLMHHALIAYYYFISGKWELPDSRFYAVIGSLSVSLFFMITGFLFGFKLFKDEFEIKKFFVSRIRRIVPLYVFSVFLLIFVIFYINDFTLKEDIGSLFKNIIGWFSFKFADFHPINLDSRVYEIQSVYWTLKWEWKFYLFLPILFFFRKKLLKNKDVAFIVVLLIAALLYKFVFVFIFLLGVLAAFLYLKGITFNKTLLNGLGMISLVGVMIFFDLAYNKIAAALLGIFFLSVVLTNNLYKLFNIKIIRYFGTISYSIYLLHNIMVFITFYIINENFKLISDFSFFEYCLTVLFILTVTSIFSIFTYKYIEHKFYKRGKL